MCAMSGKCVCAVASKNIVQRMGRRERTPVSSVKPQRPQKSFCRMTVECSPSIQSEIEAIPEIL